MPGPVPPPPARSLLWLAHNARSHRSCSRIPHRPRFLPLLQANEFQVQARRLPKALRDWAAYKDCRRTIDDFLALLPLFQALSHKSIRERWACLAGRLWLSAATKSGRHSLGRLAFSPYNAFIFMSCIVHCSSAQRLPDALPAGTGRSCRPSQGESSTWPRMRSSCSTCWTPTCWPAGGQLLKLACTGGGAPGKPGLWVGQAGSSARAATTEPPPEGS